MPNNAQETRQSPDVLFLEDGPLKEIFDRFNASHPEQQIVALLYDDREFHDLARLVAVVPEETSADMRERVRLAALEVVDEPQKWATHRSGSRLAYVQRLSGSE